MTITPEPEPKPMKGDPDVEPLSIFLTEHWTRYRVTIEFRDWVVGGAPSDPKLIEGWLASRLGITDDDLLRAWTRKHLAETQGIDHETATPEELDRAIEEALDENAAEKKAQVFKREPGTGYPYIEGRHVKAMLKEAVAIAYPAGVHKWGSYLSTSVKNKGNTVGGKNPRDYLAERVFVPERRIVVGTEVDGVELAVGHIKDHRGTRSVLGYFEYIECAVITFEVRVLDDFITPEQWARIWTVAEMEGLGARRSQGYGTFAVTAWERVSD